MSNSTVNMKVLFKTLRKPEEEMDGVEIPKEFQGKAHRDLLEGLRLNLLDLPDGTISGEELEQIARPFA